MMQSLGELYTALFDWWQRSSAAPSMTDSECQNIFNRIAAVWTSLAGHSNFERPLCRHRAFAPQTSPARVAKFMLDLYLREMSVQGLPAKKIHVRAVMAQMPAGVVHRDFSGSHELDHPWIMAVVEKAEPASVVMELWDRLTLTPELAYSLFCSGGGCDLPSMAAFASRFADSLGSSVATVDRDWLEYQLARDFFEHLAAFCARNGVVCAASSTRVCTRIALPGRYFHDDPALLQLVGASDFAIEQARDYARVRQLADVRVAWSRRRTLIEQILLDYHYEEEDEFAKIEARAADNIAPGLSEDDVMLIDHEPVEVVCRGVRASFDPRALCIQTDDGEGRCPRAFAAECGAPDGDWKDHLLLAQNGVCLGAWMRWAALGRV